MVAFCTQLMTHSCRNIQVLTWNLEDDEGDDDDGDATFILPHLKLSH